MSRFIIHRHPIIKLAEDMEHTDRQDRGSSPHPPSQHLHREGGKNRNKHRIGSEWMNEPVRTHALTIGVGSFKERQKEGLCLDTKEGSGGQET